VVVGVGLDRCMHYFEADQRNGITGLKAEPRIAPTDEKSSAGGVDTSSLPKVLKVWLV